MRHCKRPARRRKLGSIGGSKFNDLGLCLASGPWLSDWPPPKCASARPSNYSVGASHGFGIKKARDAPTAKLRGKTSSKGTSTRKRHLTRVTSIIQSCFLLAFASLIGHQILSNVFMGQHLTVISHRKLPWHQPLVHNVWNIKKSNKRTRSRFSRSRICN